MTAHDPAQLARRQVALRQALETFLTVPPFAVGRVPVRPIPTAALAEATGERLRGRITPRAYAERLAQAYAGWGPATPAGDPRTVPVGPRFDDWGARGGADERFDPVRRLRALAAAAGHFDRAIVHGSAATLDDTPGFSDLDVAFVVREQTLRSADALLDLRRVANAAFGATLEFDPAMHHAPYYLPAPDLRAYPEPWFPLVLFEHGLELLDDPAPLTAAPREAPELTDTALDTFRRFFAGRPRPFALTTWFDVEWVLGNAMILPALYLQRKTGAYRYKRDTFTPVREGLGEELYEPVATASRIRAELPPRPHPPHALVTAARALQSPELLRQWSRLSPQLRARARAVGEQLGPDFPDRVVRLIDAMTGRLR